MSLSRAINCTGSAPSCSVICCRPSGGRGYYRRNSKPQGDQPYRQTNGSEVASDANHTSQNGSYGSHENGSHANGLIAAIHTNGHAHHHKKEPLQVQPAFAELTSSDLEQRKLALATESAKLHAVNFLHQTAQLTVQLRLWRHVARADVSNHVQVDSPAGHCRPL